MSVEEEKSSLPLDFRIKSGNCVEHVNFFALAANSNRVQSKLTMYRKEGVYSTYVVVPQHALKAFVKACRATFITTDKEVEKYITRENFIYLELLCDELQASVLKTKIDETIAKWVTNPAEKTEELVERLKVAHREQQNEVCAEIERMLADDVEGALSRLIPTWEVPVQSVYRILKHAKDHDREINHQLLCKYILHMIKWAGGSNIDQVLTLFDFLDFSQITLKQLEQMLTNEKLREWYPRGSMKLVSHLMDQVNPLVEELQKRKTQADALIESYEDVVQRLDEKFNQLAAREQKLMESEQAKLREEVMSYERKRADEAETMSNRIQSSVMEKINESLGPMATKLQEMEERNMTLEDQVKKLQDQIKDLHEPTSTELRQMKERNATLEDQVQELQAQIKDLHGPSSTELQEVKKRNATLEDQVEKLLAQIKDRQVSHHASLAEPVCPKEDVRPTLVPALTQVEEKTEEQLPKQDISDVSAGQIPQQTSVHLASEVACRKRALSANPKQTAAPLSKSEPSAPTKSQQQAPPSKSEPSAHSESQQQAPPSKYKSVAAPVGFQRGMSVCSQHHQRMCIPYSEGSKAGGILKRIRASVHVTGSIPTDVISKKVEKLLPGSSHGDYYESKGDSDWAYFCVDFDTYRVQPTHYTLKTYTLSLNKWHLKSWAFEGQCDGEKDWVVLDEQKNNNDLNGADKEKTFEIKSNDPREFRFLRIRMTDKNHAGTRHMTCAKFEVYGTLIEP